MIARLFAALVVLVLVGRAVGTYAEAGVVNIVMCCCPSVDVCKCHDHDEPAAPTQMKRCGGAVHEVAPAPMALTLPTPPSIPAIAIRVQVVETATPPLPDDRSLALEKPPF